MKELKINVPEGYEIDKENSTFECIKFKPIVVNRWRDNEYYKLYGYYIDNESEIFEVVGVPNKSSNYNVFATKELTKSALAMARISQIMAHDKRFGGIITEEEWKIIDSNKYVIRRCRWGLSIGVMSYTYYFLAFHTKEQAELFLKENEDLVKDYYML